MKHFKRTLRHIKIQNSNKYAKMYWIMSIKSIYFQKFPYFTQYLWWVILAWRTTSNEENKFKDFFQNFKISNKEIEEGIEILQQINTSEYKEYNPKNRLRSNISSKRDKTLNWESSIMKSRCERKRSRLSWRKWFREKSKKNWWDKIINNLRKSSDKL